MRAEPQVSRPAARTEGERGAGAERSGPAGSRWDALTLTRLQGAVGNAAVGRLLAPPRGPPHGPPEIQRTLVDAKRFARENKLAAIASEEDVLQIYVDPTINSVVREALLAEYLKPAEGRDDTTSKKRRFGVAEKPAAAQSIGPTPLPAFNEPVPHLGPLTPHQEGFPADRSSQGRGMPTPYPSSLPVSSTSGDDFFSLWQQPWEGESNAPVRSDEPEKREKPEKEEPSKSVNPGKEEKVEAEASSASTGWGSWTDENGTVYLVTTVGSVTWWYVPSYGYTHLQLVGNPDIYVWSEEYRSAGYEPPPPPTGSVAPQLSVTTPWYETTTAVQSEVPEEKPAFDRKQLQWKRSDPTTLTDSRYGLIYITPREATSWQKEQPGKLYDEHWKRVTDRALEDSAALAHATLSPYKAEVKKEKNFRDSYGDFRLGDLLYGVNEARDDYMRPVKGKQLAYGVIDDLNAHFLGTKTGYRYGQPIPEADNDSTVKREAATYRTALEDYLTKRGKMFTEEQKAGKTEADVNLRITRSIKFGLEYAAARNNKVRFVLDRIDMEHVVDPDKNKKHYRDFTSKELRSLYRRRKDAALMQKIVFIDEGKEVKPPWVTHASTWAKYKPRSEKGSQ